MTDDPRIVSVELLPGSLAVWRAINDEDPAAYPIRLRLSRPLDEFERNAVRSIGPPYLPADDDPASVLLPLYTLEAVRVQLDEMNNQLANAAAIGQHQRERAITEDDRLQALEAEINAELGDSDA
jgi:hypothetical protein